MARLSIGILAWLAVATVAFWLTRPGAPELRFVALGDGPYGDPLTQLHRLKSVRNAVNEVPVDLVVHVGDTQGFDICDNTRTDAILEVINGFSAPVLYTPGDNEWTDCGRNTRGDTAPLSRLEYIRKTHFFSPGRSLGAQPIALENQSARGYPENARLRMGSVGFISAHVVGSNNNFLPYNIEAVKEFQARNAANVDWLEAGFEEFKDAKAIVIAIHADMYVPQYGFKNGWWSTSPYHEFGRAVGRLTNTYDKPVLLVFGDSHQHKFKKPYPEFVPQLTILEVYGHPDMKAIEVQVRPDSRRVWRLGQVFGED